MGRGLIFLAEWIQSLESLAPADAEARRCLREALQLEVSPIQAAPSPPVEAPAPRLQPVPLAPVVLPEPMPRVSNPTHLAPPVPSRLQPVLILDEPGEPRDWEQGEVLPAEKPEALSRPPHEPLFARLQQAAILSTALATRVEEGEVEVEKVIDTLAAGRPTVRLFRRPIPTLRRGLQLLVDMGEGMAPFARDRRELLEAVRRHAGREKVEVKLFRRSPLHGVGQGTARTEWRAWCPPAPGVPVVLLSELGIGEPLLQRDRALPSEWLRFAARVRRAGCPLVAIVPYEPERWPVALRKAMALIPWDRETTTLAVRKATRSHRAGGR